MKKSIKPTLENLKLNICMYLVAITLLSSSNCNIGKNDNAAKNYSSPGIPETVVSQNLQNEFQLAKTILYDLYVWSKNRIGNIECKGNLIPIDSDLKLDTTYYDKQFTAQLFHFNINSELDNKLSSCGERIIHSIWIDNKDKNNIRISHWGFNDYVVFEFKEFSNTEKQEIQNHYQKNIKNISKWIFEYNLKR